MPCCMHGTLFYTEFDSSVKTEIAFVQWTEFIAWTTLSLAEIDRTFNCIKIRWQQTSGGAGLQLSVAGHKLIPPGPVRIIVNLAQRDSSGYSGQAFLKVAKPSGSGEGKKAGCHNGFTGNIF